MQSFADGLGKRCATLIATLRQQAPAARMIGKFAVKQASDELEKRLRPRDDEDESTSKEQ
jgi:hypothetical protein